jgi:4-amino-4-deoxy-L-arabinose transferase-like glycosyltransferase
MDAPPWSAAERRAAVGLAALLLGSLPFLVHGWYDPVNDAAMYIASARSLAAGEGYRFVELPFTMRPPGLALLLTPLVAVRGTDFLALNLLVACFGAAGVLLLYVWVRPRLGWLAGLALALAVWFNPGFRRLSSQVISDVPGLTLLLLGFVTARWADARPSWRRDALLALCIGLGAHLRSALVILLPAVLLVRVCAAAGSGVDRAAWRAFAVRQAALVALVLALLAPWSLRNWLVAPEPPADQTRNYSYGAAMWHENPRDPASPRLSPGDILGRADRRSRQLTRSLGRRLWPYGIDREAPLAPGELAGAVLLLGAVLVVALRRREAAEVYALLYAALVLIYFGYHPRLALPIYAIGLAALGDLLRTGAARAVGARAAGAVAAIALLALAALDFEPRRGWDRLQEGHQRRLEKARALRARLAPDDRVAAVAGLHDSVYLERSIWGLHWAIRDAGDPAAAEPIIDKYAIDTVLVGDSKRGRELAAYLEQRYGEPERAGSVRLWRVRP